MLKIIPVIIILSLMSSCVTMFNHETTHFYVRTIDEGNAQLVYHKEYAGVKTRKGIKYPEEGAIIPLGKKGACVFADRSQTQVLPVTIKSDSTEKTVYIKPRISPMYYFNLAHIFPLLSFGFLIDHKNPNRFGYPCRVYVDMSDADKRYFPAYPPEYILHPRKPSYFDLDVAPPLGNLYVFKLRELQPGVSIFNFSATLNYHYSTHRYLSVEASIAAAMPLFEHRPVDSFSVAQYGLPSSERSSGWFVNVRNNYTAGRFEFGYGISFGEHLGNKSYTTLKQEDSVVYHKSAYGLGGALSVTYRINSFFSAYATYQPQFVSFSDNIALSYEYLMSMGIKFRMNLTRRR